jgi:hypothetical protein
MRFVAFVRQDALVIAARGQVEVDVGVQGETIDEALERVCDVVMLAREDAPPPMSETPDTVDDPQALANAQREDIGTTLANFKEAIG